MKSLGDAMTCDLFREFICKSPWDRTNAEIGAIVKHDDACQECRSWRLRRLVEADGRTTEADKKMGRLSGRYRAVIAAEDPESGVHLRDAQ